MTRPTFDTGRCLPELPRERSEFGRRWPLEAYSGGPQWWGAPGPRGEVDAQQEPLRALLADLTYKPGWRWRLTEPEGVAEAHRLVRQHGGRCGAMLRLGHLEVQVACQDSINLGDILVTHMVAIPAVGFVGEWPTALWRRWLLDTFVGIETHEACEFFALDGERPYWPAHGTVQEPGNPYRVPVQEDERAAAARSPFRFRTE